MIRDAYVNFYTTRLTLSCLGKRLVSVFESSAHKSAYGGPINMIPSLKWICYVLPIHVACSIMQIGPLVPKLAQATAGDRAYGRDSPYGAFCMT